jgi:hypothetical protein
MPFLSFRSFKQNASEIWGGFDNGLAPIFIIPVSVSEVDDIEKASARGVEPFVFVGNVVRAFFEAFQGFLGGNPVLAVPAEIGGGVGKVSHKRKGRWFLIQCGAFSPPTPRG